MFYNLKKMGKNVCLCVLMAVLLALSGSTIIITHSMPKVFQLSANKMAIVIDDNDEAAHYSQTQQPPTQLPNYNPPPYQPQNPQTPQTQAGQAPPPAPSSSSGANGGIYYQELHQAASLSSAQALSVQHKVETTGANGQKQTQVLQYGSADAAHAAMEYHAAGIYGLPNKYFESPDYQKYQQQNQAINNNPAAPNTQPAIPVSPSQPPIPVSPPKPQPATVTPIPVSPIPVPVTPKPLPPSSNGSSGSETGSNTLPSPSTPTSTDKKIATSVPDPAPAPAPAPTPVPAPIPVPAPEYEAIELPPVSNPSAADTKIASGTPTLTEEENFDLPPPSNPATANTQIASGTPTMGIGLANPNAVPMVFAINPNSRPTNEGDIEDAQEQTVSTEPSPMVGLASPTTSSESHEAQTSETTSSSSQTPSVSSETPSHLPLIASAPPSEEPSLLETLTASPPSPLAASEVTSSSEAPSLYATSSLSTEVHSSSNGLPQNSSSSVTPAEDSSIHSTDLNWLTAQAEALLADEHQASEPVTQQAQEVTSDTRPHLGMILGGDVGSASS